MTNGDCYGLEDAVLFTFFDFLLLELIEEASLLSLLPSRHLFFATGRGSASGVRLLLFFTTSGGTSARSSDGSGVTERARALLSGITIMCLFTSGVLGLAGG